jgi:hypothetical protein
VVGKGIELNLERLGVRLQESLILKKSMKIVSLVLVCGPDRARLDAATPGEASSVLNSHIVLDCFIFIFFLSIHAIYFARQLRRQKPSVVLPDTYCRGRCQHLPL